VSDPDAFRTVAGPVETTFEIRGSRFTGSLAPARSREDAEAFVDRRRADHPDATHVVPAYRVPADPNDERGHLREYANDDGEPGGSAGKPALNVLEQREVRNVVLAVVRYHGGQNLGVAGASVRPKRERGARRGGDSRPAADGARRGHRRLRRLGNGSRRVGECRRRVRRRLRGGGAVRRPGAGVGRRIAQKQAAERDERPGSTGLTALLRRSARSSPSDSFHGYSRGLLLVSV